MDGWRLNASPVHLKEREFFIMDAPTDIPLKIQLGWRYHAPAAEEPARTRKKKRPLSQSQHYCNTLARDGRLSQYWWQTFLVPAVMRAFIPNIHLLWTDSTFQHHLQVSHFSLSSRCFLWACKFGGKPDKASNVRITCHLQLSGR